MSERNILKYRSVWAGTIDGDPSQNPLQIASRLFRTFNIDHPEGYLAHSLSCGDVVGINPGSGMCYYFCGRDGWSDVTDLFQRS